MITDTGLAPEQALRYGDGLVRVPVETKGRETNHELNEAPGGEHRALRAVVRASPRGRHSAVAEAPFPRQRLKLARAGARPCCMTVSENVQDQAKILRPDPGRRFREIFPGVEKPLIAMAHVPALPGTPLYNGSGGVSGLVRHVPRGGRRSR